jgi:hypothetical protein
MFSSLPTAVLPILLLLCSNIFMTLAWYGHLLFKDARWWLVILVSWLIALPEYCLAVPANRLGHVGQDGAFTANQLKILQEGISISIFLIFSLLVLKESLRWQDLGAFALILGGLALALSGRGG